MLTGFKVFGITLFAFCLGCASISVRQIEESKSISPQNPPDIIYVAPFDVEKADFRVDREGEELVEFKKATATVLQEAIVERISKAYVTAQPLEAHAILPKAGWIIIGKFIRVNQGSRALRAIVGFGAGGTKMETEVFVYDLSQVPPVPFLAFNLTS